MPAPICTPCATLSASGIVLPPIALAAVVAVEFLANAAEAHSPAARRLWQMPSVYIEGEAVHMNFDAVMVFLSGLIAAVGAFATLTTSAYIRLVRNTRWYFILLFQCGLGLGVCTVWVMHFVAMRSVSLWGGEESGGKDPLVMGFDLLITALSALLAWMLSTLALHIALSRKASAPRTSLDGEAAVRLLVSTVILALSIGSMHYVGMLSERGPFIIHYDIGMMVLSAFVAVLCSSGVMSLVMHLPNSTRWRLAGSWLVAVLVCSIHFFALLPLTHRAHPVGLTWSIIWRPVEVRAESPVIVSLVLDMLLMALNGFYLEVIQVRDKTSLEKELQHVGFVAGAKKLMKRCKYMQFPMAVLRATDFVKLGKIVQHELLRDKKLLVMLDTPSAASKLRRKGCIVFFSHQWLASESPDPAGHQFKDMLNAIQELAHSRRLRTDQIYIWVDYSSIPQRSAEQQQLAVTSLPAYVSACSEFVVIAPQVLHSNTKVPCNFTSYSGRFWCRLEVFCALMTAMQKDHAQNNMLMTQRVSTIKSEAADDELLADVQVTVESSDASMDGDFHHKQRIYMVCEGKLQPLLFMGPHGLKDDFVDLLRVYDGQLDCCKRGHRTASGEEVQCDKVRVVDTLTGLYGIMVVQLLKMRKERDCSIIQQSFAQLGDTVVQQRKSFFPEQYFGSRIEAVHEYLSQQSKNMRDHIEAHEQKDDNSSDVDMLVLELDAALLPEEASVSASASDASNSAFGRQTSEDADARSVDQRWLEEQSFSV